jgi:hypothetical protein
MRSHSAYQPDDEQDDENSSEQSAADVHANLQLAGQRVEHDGIHAVGALANLHRGIVEKSRLAL